jgi:hypothetical protein
LPKPNEHVNDIVAEVRAEDTADGAKSGRAAGEPRTAA